MHNEARKRCQGKSRSKIKWKTLKRLGSGEEEKKERVEVEKKRQNPQEFEQMRIEYERLANEAKVVVEAKSKGE